MVNPPDVAPENRTQAPLLVLRDVTRTFGGLCAVDNVSFDIREGEIFALIGPNGAGKTTLFNLITGLTSLSSGMLFYRGENITDSRPHVIAKKGISRTFQNIRLFGNLSALDNVMIAQHVHGRTGVFSGVLALPRARREERATRERAMNLLSLVGLVDRWYIKAKNFSYGDQRRLEIARALALQPQMLLLDEPGAGMNMAEKQRLTAFIRDLRSRFDLTILLIEHHVPLVMDLADRIAVLDFGQLIALGVPEEIRSNPAVIEAYLGEET